MIVVGSSQKFKIGTILEGITGPSLGDGIIHQPLCIIREATEQEWRQSVIDHGGEPFTGSIPAGSCFYEVITD